MPAEKSADAIDVLREKQIKSYRWTYLGEGYFHKVYLSETVDAPIADDHGDSEDYKGPWVKKVTHSKRGDITDFVRQHRLFKSIEPDMPLRTHQNEAFFMPYLGRRDASTPERAQKVLDIFKKTGRILMDGNMEGNLLCHKGKTYCVDVDMAVRPDSPLSVSGFFKTSHQANKAYHQDHKTWFEAIRQYHLLPKNLKSSFMNEVDKVVLGLIDLSEYFGQDNVPETYLTLPFMATLHELRRTDRSIKVFLSTITQDDKTESLSHRPQ